MIGSAGSFWLLVLTSSSDANSALSLFGIVCRAVGTTNGEGGGRVPPTPWHSSPQILLGIEAKPSPSKDLGLLIASWIFKCSLLCAEPSETHGGTGGTGGQ